MNEQLELFDFEYDLRVTLLRIFILSKLVENEKWNPSAKDLIEIGDIYKVVGRKTLNILEELREEKIILKQLKNRYKDV